MPFDPQGNFTRVMNWQDDAANSIPIVASRHDDEDDNFAQGLSNTLCRDGRAAMTGNLKMGSFKITGLGNGTNKNDAVNKGQLDAQNTSLTTAINTAVRTAISNVFPVGSIYIGTQATCPLASLIPGSTWAKVSDGKVLQTSSSGHAANTTINAGLPNITGSLITSQNGINDPTNDGALYTTRGSTYTHTPTTTSDGCTAINFDASRSNSIYGNSTTVQPPAYVVNVWRRTA